MERDNSMKISEITIPVPWGHIAAKTWGDGNDPLILCVHGVLDNAGTFDRLIPYLSSAYYYVCIDLPGHGKSSPFPPHLPIHSLNFILAYQEATRFFGKKFIIMGHSYGGQLGFLYAQMYPERVEKLLMLETVGLLPIPADVSIHHLTEKVETHLKILNNLTTKSPPTYTRQEALERIQLGRRHGDVKRESAEALLERSIEPIGDRYRFTTDQRIKNFIDPLRDNRLAIESMKHNPVKCPVILILGRENTSQLQIMKPVINYLKKQKNVEVHVVKGNHDVHNDYPERVVPYIHKFLLPMKGKL